MSQPEPGWTDEEQALLKAAELDQPTPGAQSRTLAALGIGGAVLSGVAAASSAKAAALNGTAPSAALSTAVAGSKAFGLVKVLALVVAVGAAGGVALHYRAQAHATGTSVAPPHIATPAIVNAVASSTPVEAANDAGPAEPAAETASSKPTAPAPTHTEPDIALEIQSLDRARQASERGDFAAALSELDQYDRSFKQGRLRPEALLLRVQTLISKGDSAGAKALGGRFLARYPKSPLAPRIQKLLGTAN